MILSRDMQRVIRVAAFIAACYLGIIAGNAMAPVILGRGWRSLSEMDVVSAVGAVMFAPLGLLFLIAMRPDSGVVALCAIVGGAIVFRRRLWSGIAVGGFGMAIAAYLCARAWILLK